MFGLQIVPICNTAFELCVRKRMKEEREEERTLLKFTFSFLTLRRIIGTVMVVFTSECIRVLSIRALYHSAVVLFELVLHIYTLCTECFLSLPETNL